MYVPIHILWTPLETPSTACFPTQSNLEIIGFVLQHFYQQNHDTFLNYDRAREQKPESNYSQKFKLM